MRRTLLLGAGIVVVFALTIAIMWQLMPIPRKQVDYLVMGATATMLSMAVLFIVLINTTHKSKDIFYKRRKPEPPTDPVP
ncbi:MAG: hypothetical protein IT167_14045 [Bryobacterales bacterium]|nr:hypothetical protein [Bryobacterales bacterium]